MVKKYIVRLTESERQELSKLVSTGKTAAYKIKHANILLKADADGPGRADEQIASAFCCAARGVFNLRQRFVAEGLQAALGRRQRLRPPRERILDGANEARLLKIACSKAPEGHARWTLRLLAKELVKLDIVPTISAPTVMRTLKKTRSDRTCANTG